jgi:AcrR family transcriptional regulator
LLLYSKRRIKLYVVYYYGGKVEPNKLPRQNRQVSRRERKKQATRLTIINVAMDLFKQQGFHNTAMEQIAERSDVSKATLYKYFAVKEAIIAAYWQEEVKNSRDALQRIIHQYPDTRSRLEAAFRFFMSHIMQSRELYEIYIS